MIRARRSGIRVKSQDVPIILRMVERGDRRHDIAAWFGLNQGRIKEIEDGKHGHLSLAPASDPNIPPSGSPGIKAKELKRSADQACKLLKSGKPSDVDEAKNIIEQALIEFSKNA